MFSEYLYLAGDLVDREGAEKVAARLALEVTDQAAPKDPSTLYLQWRDGILSLRLLDAGIWVDFARHFHRLKVTGGFSRKGLMAKAVGGPSAVRPLLVFDATAGLGKDALLLAGLGCQVIACETNPVLFELLQNGLERPNFSSALKEVLGRIEWHHVDSVAFLSNDKGGSRPDVVYLDPMYPEKKKSALPKKEMQILQSLLGPDQNAEKLMEVALRTAGQRVVVKRPLTAPPILPNPQHSYEGKTVRYDMYIAHSAVDRS